VRSFRKILLENRVVAHLRRAWGAEINAPAACSWPRPVEERYSYRSAITGMTLAALRAGYKPKTTPATTDTRKLPITAVAVTETGQPVKYSMA